MKTGIVLEIKGGRAVLLISGGGFITVAAGSGWKTGDLVTLRPPGKHYTQLIAAAACLCIIFSLALFGYEMYFRQTSLISIDVNPSIELAINGFHRVTSAKALNQEGKAILEQADLMNKKLNTAMDLLFEQGLYSYVTDDSYITFTVFSSTKSMESYLLKELDNTALNLISSKHRTTQIETYAVDEQTVLDAHSHQVTAGKYNALKELMEVLPQADMELYSHCGIGEIKEKIRQHSGCGAKQSGTDAETAAPGKEGCRRHHGD